MAHLAEPLMTHGGTPFTMSYYGSQRVVENYNVIGVAKAALRPLPANPRECRQFSHTWKSHR
jgi:enoyl-[acyl-carrier-protein] reductase (NADH)